MKFPVDLLADVGQAELERSAHDYMNNLLYSDPDCPDRLNLSNSTQVTIDISSVGFVPLYGSGDKQKVLALFSPSDPFTAVALYLLDRWWAVDDILKTADPTRGGAVEVETLGERIVLYILNRVVYRAKEMSPEELPFLCHWEKDNAKILWNDGEAVGFYSVKPSGSFWSSFSTRSYQLPVMDSIFVRKSQRGKGFGLQMLEDFVLSFKEDCLGLRYPVTKFMYKVCGQYLCQYPGDTDLLWEVENIGGPKQRTNIARKIQAMDQSVSRSLTFTEESLVITERTGRTGRTEKDVMTEAAATQMREAGSMGCTVEIVEEVTVLRVTKVSEAEVPLAARGRSSGSKRRRMGEKMGEDKAEKVIRIEDIEAESRSKDQISAQQKAELNVSELAKAEGMSSVAPEEQGEDMVDTAPDDAAEMLDQPDAILAQQDLEEADVTSAPSTEEPQGEDDAHQNLNSQITVEIEEECQEEDTAALAVCEEASEEAETLDKVGEGTHVGVTNEKSEETVTQREASLSTRATSENGEAGKTGRANVEAVTTVQSMTPGRRCTRHSAATVTMEEKQCAVSEICADAPGGDDVEGNLPLAEVDESMSYEEEEAPVVETEALRRKTSTTTARRKSTRGRKQVDAQEAENSEEEPAVTTRTLRRGRMSTTDSPRGKSRRSRKQIQEETQKGEEESKGVEETGAVEEDAAKEAAVEKTDEEIVDTVKETASEEEEGLELKMDDAEEEVAEQQRDAEEEVAEQQRDAEEVITKLGSDPPTEVDEEDEMEAENEDLVTAELESEEGTMRMTVEEEDTAGVTAAADDLVQEETGAPLPSPPTDSAAVPPPVEEEEATPSAEEQQSEDMATQLPDLRRVTVVLVDLQKPHHDVQEEAAAAEEGLPVRKTAAEAEVEAAKIQDPGEGRDEETAEEEEAKSVHVEEQKPLVTETTTPRSGTKAVEAPPRTRGRPRKGQVRKEAAPGIQTEEPAAQVRVLRTGRTSLPVAQRSTAKRTREQLQEEEEGGEESTAVEASEEEEEQQRTDQEKEESLEERDAAEEVAEMASEKEDTEEAVNQHDAQEDVDSTEAVAGEDTEASAERDHEEKTFVVAEEAVAERDTAGGEQSTSASEVAERVPEMAKDASEEEAPAAERVPRSGAKTARATTRSKTTKEPGDEEEEEAPGEKSTEEDEPAVEFRVPRKGRKPAEASPRRKSKRARTQCQTEEEGEEEATPAEEIEGEEEEAGWESPEEKGIEVEEMEEEEEATAGDAEQTEDASTAEVLEEEDGVEAVDGTRTDDVLPSSLEVEESTSAAEEETAVAGQPTAAEVGSDAGLAEEEAPVEEASAVAEEDAPAATTRALRKLKASPATPPPRPRRQKDDSPRRSVRKRPKVDYRENNEGNADEEKEVPGASDEDQGNQESERSSNADEAGEAAGSSQEDEEYERNTSEEEEEPTAIGKRVLRGRSVPSVVVTPQPPSGRRGAKEKILRSARKRKSTAVTRKSKRLSQV